MNTKTQFQLSHSPLTNNKYKYPLVQYASAGLGVGLGMIGVDYLRARNRNPDPDTGFGRMEEFKAVLDYNTNDIIKANLCVTLAVSHEVFPWPCSAFALRSGPIWYAAWRN